MPIRATNCNDCGCLPCCCVTKTDGDVPIQRGRESSNCPRVVRQSVGDCVPLQPDPLDLINNHCRPAQGGDKTIGAPEYVFTVENAPDGVLRDSEGRPVLDLSGNVVANVG